MIVPKARIIDPRDVPKQKTPLPCIKCKGSGIVYKHWGRMLCPFCHDWNGNKLAFPYRNARIFTHKEG